MAGFITKIYSLFFVLALFLYSAFPAFAQSVVAIPADGDDTVTITAQVAGCGDNIIDPALGEQCEGPNIMPYDLNGQTCMSLGYNKGTLSCRPASCVFDVSDCENKGSKIRDVSNIFPRTRIVFNGNAQPGSTFFVVANGSYLISIRAGIDGNFSVPVNDAEYGDYDFQFYALSAENGLMGPRNFSQYVPRGMTTYINNIFITFPDEEVIDIPVEDIPIDNITETSLIIPVLPTTTPGTELATVTPTSPTTNNGATNGLSGDLYAQFLDVLSQNENLTPEELRKLIEDFSQQHGYEARVPGYSRNGYRLGVLPYLERQWELLPATGRKWYPNVYVSFMEPYRMFFYEITSWYNEWNNPVTQWLRN